MKLNLNQIKERLAEIENWELKEESIYCSLKFKDFKEAMEFINKAADEAEKMDHHPDIYISYNKVELTLTTHSEGGLTKKDFTLAEKINQL